MESKRLLRSVSHAQSSVDGFQPACHRLDLLITEQRILVKTTQESLQEALSQFKASSSKEEQESARMQVQSLLSRAQELVVTVQVILHIRSEIGHTQLEIRNAKARHEPTSKLHGRLQWLEQHLEKMLMARRRGRPGAHGGRRLQTQAPVGATRGVRGRPARESVAVSSRGDNISDFDRESSWRSIESLGTARNAQSLSSKHSQTGSHDSDAWHSESEANWTTVEVYSNQPKDITQSQVLSEDEPKHNEIGYTPSWAKSVVTEQSLSSSFHAGTGGGERNSHLPTHFEDDSFQSSSSSSTTGKSSLGNVLTFEPRRSLEVFGDCSWNSLSLAINSNFVRSASGMAQDLSGLSMSMLHAGVSDITKDIESLKKVIVNAGQAATGTGSLVSVSKTGVRFALSSAHTRLRRSLGEEGKSLLRDLGGLSSSDDITLECYKLSPSKKRYGKQVTRNRSSTFPRSTSIWCEPPNCDTTQLPPLPRSVSGSAPSSAILQRLSSLSKSPVNRKKSARRYRGVSTSRENSSKEKVDVFDKEKHQERRISDLLQQLTSSVAPVRKSSVQALGMLSAKNEEVAKNLQEIMVADVDPVVQYEALKSLIALGIMNDEIISFAGICLRGSPDLSFDLVSFLSQDHIIQQASKSDEAQLSLIEDVHCDLLKVLKRGQPGSAFLVALLLSQVSLERELSVEILKKALSSSSPPEHQNQALCCLIRHWGCFDHIVICSALQQMDKLNNWKFRQQAIECLLKIDKKELVLSSDENGRNIYDVLLQRLPNEPILAVRASIGRLLAHLELQTKAENALIGRLDSGNEVVRAEAVIAMSAFGSPSAKTVRVLTECLNLDPSNYVRVQVAKVFSNMWQRSPLILNQLVAKSRGTGPVAQECSTILQEISKS